jgi:alkylation response protein AidB-like acyl-CoA dehydrogenase
MRCVRAQSAASDSAQIRPQPSRQMSLMTFVIWSRPICRKRPRAYCRRAMRRGRCGRATARTAQSVELTWAKVRRCTRSWEATHGDGAAEPGGNGILLEHNVRRFVADAEAIYSYEGTREMTTLIVGKSITGISAFVRGLPHGFARWR